MNGLPPGISAADIDPSDLPEGFTTAGPSGRGEGDGSGSMSGKAQQADAQRAAILEQCVS